MAIVRKKVIKSRKSEEKFNLNFPRFGAASKKMQ
jgi:hypothetical protein